MGISDAKAGLTIHTPENAAAAAAKPRKVRRSLMAVFLPESVPPERLSILYIFSPVFLSFAFSRIFAKASRFAFSTVSGRGKSASRVLFII